MQNAKFEQQKRWLWLLWVGSLMWSSSVLATEVSVELRSGRHLIKIAVTPFVASPCLRIKGRLNWRQYFKMIYEFQAFSIRWTPIVNGFNEFMQAM